MRKLFVAALFLFLPGALVAQTDAVEPRPEDVASPEATVAALYESLARDPTYEKRFADSEQSLGRGVNSFQLVYGDGRWWIASVAWDEENGAGPLPARYLPE